MTPRPLSFRGLGFTGLVGVIVVLSAARVAGQDSLDRAQHLYETAAYDEALVVLDRLSAGAAAGASAERVTVQRYRALCLLALGRDEEAGAAIEAIISVDPSFSPPASEISPRVRTAIADVRRRVLPDVIKQAYAEAKTAYDRREFTVAAARFGRILALFDDADLADVVADRHLQDLQTLSAGFHALSLSAARPDPPH
jgi:tetratricopeptide (TPR) repeat protein